MSYFRLIPKPKFFLFLRSCSLPISPLLWVKEIQKARIFFKKKKRKAVISVLLLKWLKLPSSGHASSTS